MPPEDQVTDPATATQEAEQQPNPMEIIMKRFDAIEQRIDSRQVETPAPAPAAVEDPANEFEFDPRKIIEASATASQQTYQLLRKAEADVRRKFAGKLDDEQIETIVGQLTTMPPKVLVDTIRKEGHMAMGYAHYGIAVESGKIKPGESKTVTAATPVGTEAPRESSAASALLAEYEGMYGKADKRTRERLLAGAR